MTDKELGEWRDYIQSAGLSPSREKGLLVFIGEVKRIRDGRDAALKALKHAHPWVETGPAGSWRDGVMAEIEAIIGPQ